VNLRFHNTLSRKVEDLRPLEAGRLGIYVCGPTVYDAPHLGHARSAVVFDVFRRFFEALGYNVTLVRNITDIDDKIILKAQATGTDYRTIAERYQNQYDAVMAALNVQAPHAAPRATAYIGTCQELVARMLRNGHAYRSGKSVYLAIHSCRDYGRLSGRSCDPLPDISRCREQPEKRHPGDFALWKGSKTGEPQWSSPWGPGRPGWHIECTAMSHALLNTPFDIHGGGRDLIFPHHENEIAQSIAAFGKPPAATWLHHGMVTVGQAKMAKSKGNAPPLETLLQARSRASFSPVAALSTRSSLYRSRTARIHRPIESALYLGPSTEGRLRAPFFDAESPEFPLAAVCPAPGIGRQHHRRHGSAFRNNPGTQQGARYHGRQPLWYPLANHPIHGG